MTFDPSARNNYKNFPKPLNSKRPQLRLLPNRKYVPYKGTMKRVRKKSPSIRSFVW